MEGMVTRCSHPGMVARRVLHGFLIVGMAACSTGSSAPDVHPAIVSMVKALKADGDCASLQAAFDRSNDADELAYIDDAMRDVGCYD